MTRPISHLLRPLQRLALRRCLAAGAVSLCAAGLLAAGPAAAQPAADSHAAAPARKIDLPPSADLQYRIKAQQGGLTIDGTGLVKWVNAAGKFSASSESRASLFGKVLEAHSDGGIDAGGLLPATFTDKRFRKEPTTTTFDRASGTIRFSESEATYSIKGGEQDRNSIIWQLIGVARGAEGKFKAGSEWPFFVVGQRDAEQWTFKVGKTETLRTAQGNVSAVHVVRALAPDAKGQQLDIWLAPSMQWYPVRLRFTDPDGEYIEQTLESIGHG
jgi:hypothetical protein